MLRRRSNQKRNTHAKENIKISLNNLREIEFRADFLQLVKSTRRLRRVFKNT